MSIGQKIKHRRTELGWSQRDLAAKMGYNNNSTVARIENGKVDIPQSRIVQFSEVLGVSIAYLMGWGDEADPADTIKRADQHCEMIMDADMCGIYEDFKLLDAAQRKIVKDLVHSLAQTKKPEA